MAVLNAQGRALPVGWRWVKLGDAITDAQPGFACGARDSAGTVQLRMNNVDTRGALVWDQFLRVPADAATLSRLQLRPGDVMFNNTNSTELVGKSALFSGHVEPVVYSNHFTRLRTARERLEPAYLALWLLMEWQVGTFEVLCNRWIGQSAVKNDKLLSLEIPLPPLPEQRRITAILTERLAAVDRARAAAQAQLSAARSLPFACLRAVFSSPEARAWPIKRLGDVSRLERGRFTPRPRNDLRYYGGPYPWIQIGEVEAADKYITRYHNTLNDLGFAVSRMFPKGTLVISIAATIGATGILTFDSCMPDSLVGVTPRQGESDAEFLYYILGFVRNHLESIAPQMAQANLKLALLEPLRIPIPGLAEQKSIAAELAVRTGAAQSLAKTLQYQLELINKLPAALLRQAFNGEL